MISSHATSTSCMVSERYCSKKKEMSWQNVPLIHDNVFNELGGVLLESDEAGELHDINQA